MVLFPAARENTRLRNGAASVESLAEVAGSRVGMKMRWSVVVIAGMIAPVSFAGKPTLAQLLTHAESKAVVGDQEDDPGPLATGLTTLRSRDIRAAMRKVISVVTGTTPPICTRALRVQRQHDSRAPERLRTAPTSFIRLARDGDSVCLCKANGRRIMSRSTV
jgi:hypothetical protein